MNRKRCNDITDAFDPPSAPWPRRWRGGRRQWLEGFAYRIALGPLVFVAAGGVALLVAALTVSTQALRAARANPAEALRDE